jgi:hypothetical protein
VRAKHGVDDQTSIKLKALYPLCPPFRIHSDSSLNLYNQFLSDFETQKAISIRGSFVHSGEPLAIVLRRCTANQKTRLFSKSRFFETGDPVLEFSGTFQFPGQDKFFATDHTGAKIARTEDQSVAEWKSFLPHDLELTIQSYFCALAIAYQGAMRPIGNVWILNGSKYKTDRYYLSEIHDSIEFLRRNNAFPEIALEPDKAIKWVFAQNGIFDGYSDTSASRALNYFTRLFVSEFRNDELSDLVSALAGVESLLVKGGRSSVGQLKEKLSALFAANIEPAWLLKMITEAYDFRSRMVHGNRQIRSFFRSGEEESEKRFNEEYHSHLFAIGMLVLLLRFVISKDLQELAFQTVFTV